MGFVGFNYDNDLSVIEIISKKLTDHLTDHHI